MEQLTREKVDRLAEDIAFVRKAIEKNSSILQQIDFRKSLRMVVLLTALSVLAFCGTFQLLLGRFGSYHAIPATVKFIVFGVMALIVAFLGILKNTDVLKSARTVVPDMSLTRLIKEYYTGRIYHHFIPVGLVCIFALAYAFMTGHHQFLVPILAISTGLLYNNFNTLLQVDEFLGTSYWFILTGIILFFYHSVSPFLGLCLTLGCGFLLLAVYWYLPQKNRKTE
jgi:hypothetical protein